MEIDRNSMQELLNLLEELVINKIQVEKIFNDSNNAVNRKVLSQEIQIVSKVQGVVKGIQTEDMKSVYIKIREILGERAGFIETNGDNVEFDRYDEEQILYIMKLLLNDFTENCELINNFKKVSISSFNDSTNLMIKITNQNKAIDTSNLFSKYNKKSIPLTHLNEAEIKDWLCEFGIDGFLDTFIKIYKTAVPYNISVDISSDMMSNEVIIITTSLSSSIVKAQLAEINKQVYAIPIDDIEKVISSNNADIKFSNDREYIKYADKIVPVIELEKELGIIHDGKFQSYILINYNGVMKAIPVDTIGEQTDIVVRAKPEAISEIKEFKGTTILSDGDVTMVFDAPYIVESGH